MICWHWTTSKPMGIYSILNNLKGSVFQNKSIVADKAVFSVVKYKIIVVFCSVRNPYFRSPSCSSSRWFTDGSQGHGSANYDSGFHCHRSPPELVQLRNVFKYWAGATCPSIPPTLAVDNNLQLLEVETLRRDGTFSPTGPGLEAKTAGTPGPLWNTTPGTTALCCYSTRLRSHTKAEPATDLRVGHFLTIWRQPSTRRGYSARTGKSRTLLPLLPFDSSSPWGACFWQERSHWTAYPPLQFTHYHRHP